jgi:photosystem II stability/assembly factor-like uncharacterized protein
VSGLLPITNIVAGSNVTVSISGTTYTVSSNGTGGGGGTTITNYGDNRILTSDGTSAGINAESILSFNGELLNLNDTIIMGGSGVPGSGLIRLYSYATGDNTTSPAPRILCYTYGGSSLSPSGVPIDATLLHLVSYTPDISGVVRSTAGLLYSADGIVGGSNIYTPSRIRLATSSGPLQNDNLLYLYSDGELYYNGFVNIDRGLSAPTPIYSLGSISGNISINYGFDRQIQTASLNGSITNFILGSDWPIDKSVDVVLELTINTATTILWDIVDEWYTKIPTLSIGKHLVLLRSMGSSLITGYYLGEQSICNPGDTWIPLTSSPQPYRGATSSSDGQILAVSAGLPPGAGDTPGYIYTSFDGGVTWTARESLKKWVSITSSSDGTKLLSCVHGEYLYTSTNSGVTWTPRLTDSARDWLWVTSSSSGNNLAAVVNNGQIYTSTDSGISWTARESNRNWQQIASSSDGTRLVAVVNSGQIYTSTNGGVSWTARETTRNWRCVSSNSAGTILAAGVGLNPGLIYVSTDSGVTWIARGVSKDWLNIKVFDNGIIVAMAYGDQIYISYDNGVTWSSKDVSRNWRGIAGSSDASKLIAVVQDSIIYTSRCKS